MEGLSSVLEFLEKLFNRRTILSLIGVVVAFWLGMKYNNAVRDKHEAQIINEHTKEIKAYCDSALAAKQAAHDAISTYKWMMFYQDRKIDSLNNIIKSMEDENKD